MDSPKVLDVHGASGHSAGSAPDSLNIAHTCLLDRLDEVPDDGELLIHCRGGARAAAAVALLERSGRTVSLIDDAFAH